MVRLRSQLPLTVSPPPVNPRRDPNDREQPLQQPHSVAAEFGGGPDAGMGRSVSGRIPYLGGVRLGQPVGFPLSDPSLALAVWPVCEPRV
jgi:hypothetical protein